MLDPLIVISVGIMMYYRICHDANHIKQQVMSGCNSKHALESCYNQEIPLVHFGQIFALAVFQFADAGGLWPLCHALMPIDHLLLRVCVTWMSLVHVPGYSVNGQSQFKFMFFACDVGCVHLFALVVVVWFVHSFHFMYVAMLRVVICVL